MSKKNKRKDEDVELTPEAKELVEERLQEVADGKVISTEELKERLFPNRQFEKKLLPSHWAREDGLDPHLFLWWDTNHGVVSKDEWREIKTRV